MISHRVIRPVLLLLLSLCVGSLSASAIEQPPTQLQTLRAARRQVLRTRSQNAAKTGSGVPFGLLVIPVDFAEARLPDNWDSQDLLHRLVPDSGETLHNYFRIASAERLDLKITLAPVVHLPETRRLYSDRDLNGFSRTRKLATESITAVRDLGLEFRRLDIDGPDGVAGTADDDGQVDGVLILHAGVGNENDPDAGLIQALQFFLDEPVYSQGVAASFYAVASLQSGPGIWAHETAHLLGLEDRYDPLLPTSGGSEVASVGGLGRFSLMSSGAWGTGGGFGAALPDAYSALQVGWLSARNITISGSETVRPGNAVRVWSQGAVGPEFFLMETRDPVASAPFDANVPGGNLLVYHIDENLSEGAWREDGPQEWHLRVRLVEADGDRSLATGADDGSVSDLFPGSLGVSQLGPMTVPGTTSYYDGPSGIALSGIEPLPGEVSFDVSLNTAASLVFSYSFGLDAGEPLLTLRVRETGQPLSAMSCQLRATSSGEAGYFTQTGTRTITFELSEQEPGRWEPATLVNWHIDQQPAAAPTTSFEFFFFAGSATIARESRLWAWQSTGTELDFKTDWPGQWVVEHPAGNLNTSWHRWDSAPWLTGDQTAVLACTGTAYNTAAAWPNVTYANSAHTTLTSGPLTADVAAVRLTHGIEVEMLTPAIGMDGGLVVWVAPDGRELAALPQGEYGGQINSKSNNPLHGQSAFVDPELQLAGSEVSWRTDTFVVPTAEPGPWRLRLVFAANSQWRARGWFIADIEAIGVGESSADFTPVWTGDLVWSWPWAETAAQPFEVQTRADPTLPWTSVLAEDVTAGADGLYRIEGARITAGLLPGLRQRHTLRVLGRRSVGEVASQPIVLYPDGGDGRQEVFGLPWPNPALGAVHFLLDIPTGSAAVLRVYDVKGRLVTSISYAVGQQLAAWDGQTHGGGRAAAGLYFLRLEGTGPVLTRKVVLLH